MHAYNCNTIYEIHSDHEEPFPVPVRHWQGWFRKSLEGRKNEGEETLRTEGNVQGENNFEAISPLRHERNEVPLNSQTPVRSASSIEGSPLNISIEK